MNYDEFIKSKAVVATRGGLTVDLDEINPILKPHQKACVKWAVEGGRRALFEAFGLGKSVQQLEILRLILKKTGGGRALIVAPLGVRQEFRRDTVMLGMDIRFVRRNEEVSEDGLYITNYESVRDGKLDPQLFDAVSLDEASCLRGFGGTKTFREFMAIFAGDRKTMNARTRSKGIPYRFVATATPSPNEYIELLAYSAFLDIMDVSAAKTRFFKRDSTKADHLTIHPHKEREFWLWVSSWAMFLQSPADLGFDASDYNLPEKKVHFHMVEVDHSNAGVNKSGQQLMFKNAAIGLSEAAREKRDTLDIRIAKMLDIVNASPDDHFLIWHDLESERAAIENALPEAVSVFGSQDLDEREQCIVDFSEGKFKYLAAKPVIAGSGCNFQRYCHKAIFLGIGYKFNDFIQAIHRIHRFLQKNQVEIHIVFAESEKLILDRLMEKWERDIEQRNIMTSLIQEHGLAHESLANEMRRAFGIERIEVKGELYTSVNNDCVLETEQMQENSVGLILTSIPFSTQYEYSPNYNDFGHTDNNEHFFRQMDFLTPNLLKVLQPGRIFACHVKDRIVPGGMTGLGFQTVYPFHARCIEHYTEHGFAFIGMKTIVTDVVRENNQTYRLGWSEQCKDGSKMGCGMPEYLLLFRKPPTDTTNSYADIPVVKSKDKYSRSRWQIDAHGFARSSGNRLLTEAELRSLPHDQIYKIFRKYSLAEPYDFETHVAIGEKLDEAKRLPTSFMLLPPQSWHDDVWTDITRMVTLNSSQYSQGRQMHLCLATGSLVLTKAGYVPIETVTAGDEVLTHQGRWRKVLAARQTGENKPVVHLKAQGVPNLRVTPDHKIWTRATDWVRRREGAERARPDWVRADETVNQYVNLKLPPVEPSHLTETECWLIGRWLADGHVGTRGDYIVSVGPQKLDRFLRMADQFVGTKGFGTAVQVRLKGLSEPMKRVLAKCGRGAAGKLIPAELMSLNENKAGMLLSGYLSGDGHLVESRARFMATSVSRPLLLGLALIVQRVCGTIAAVYAGRPAGTTVIDGRTVNTKQEWVISFETTIGRSKPFIKDDGAWKKVRSVDEAGSSDVWCLEVEDDASFTAEGCVVKNCPLQFDICDRVIEQMSNPGDLVLDPFGGLGTVAYRAILKGRKGYSVELSPQYFQDSLGYLRAAEQKALTPSLFDLIEAEETEVALA